MSDELAPLQPGESAGQLTQARVPLDDAAAAFSTRDENGRVPIVVEPQRVLRIQNGLLLAALAIGLAGVLSGNLAGALWLLVVAVAIAVALAVVAVFRSFIVRIPEGANGLLARGGRYTRTVGPGIHYVLPYIAVSHLVTKREIPYDVPVAEATTRDNVRAAVDTLLTFSIIEPHLFVYNISADDFDRVLQASCQDALRTLVRRLTAEEVLDLERDATARLQADIGRDVQAYGVSLNRIVVTFAQPSAEFMHSREQRQLAVVQRAEQQERQALALQRQADATELETQRIAAAEAHQELRFQQLEHRIQRYPAAARYDLERGQLDVGRALAGNNRTLLQVGGVDELARSIMLHDASLDHSPNGDTNGPPGKGTG